MKIKKIISYLLLAILAGCGPILSLHPLFTEKDLVFEEKLLGRWAQYEDTNKPPIIWRFEKDDKAETKYQLSLFKEEKISGSFTAHLVRLNNILFMDVSPDKFPAGNPINKKDPNQLEFNMHFFVPLHTFVKIELFKPISNFYKKQSTELKKNGKHIFEKHDYAMELRLTDDEKLKELIEQDPKVVKYEKLENGKIFLTASTQHLQEFVLKHADNDKLFTEEIPLVRFKKTAEINVDEKRKQTIEP